MELMPFISTEKRLNRPSVDSYHGLWNVRNGEVKNGIHA